MPDVDFYLEQRKHFNKFVRKFKGLNGIIASAKNAIDGLQQHDIDNDAEFTDEEKAEFKKICAYLKLWYNAMVGAIGQEFTVKGLGL